MMLRLGDWLQVGERRGCIQAWGIEIGFSPNSNTHPVKRTSRKKAYASMLPHVLIYFTDGSEEWWPLQACIAIPPPLARSMRDFVTSEAAS